MSNPCQQAVERRRHQILEEAFGKAREIIEEAQRAVVEMEDAASLPQSRLQQSRPIRPASQGV
jgi:vacuolar-type H+-ATPase subunit H